MTFNRTMRLIDIKRYVNIAYENFKPQFSSNGSYHYLENVQQIRKALQALRDAGILEYSETKFDITDQILSFMMKRYVLDSNQYNVYKNEFSKIQATVTVMHQWINRYVPMEDSEDIINIKLPVIQDIGALSKICSLIDKALSQTVSEYGQQVKFKQLDYGSSWITISVVTGGAAALVMALAKAAFYVAKKIYGIKLMAKEYERYSMGNEIMKTIKETNEKIIQCEMAKQAEDVEKAYYKDQESDPERVGRIRAAISELTKLIELGGEIHPSALLEEKEENKIDYKLLTSVLPQGLLTDSTEKGAKKEQE